MLPVGLAAATLVRRLRRHLHQARPRRASPSWSSRSSPSSSSRASCSMSEERAEQLEARTTQLASLQVGVLAALVQTLSLRDKMTARHSAAVARYSRAIAARAGCTPEEQELVHTAGLLHDIGKFIFPDRILFADRRLERRRLEDRQARIRPRAPAWSARSPAYGPVAEIIRCHHERIDGTRLSARPARRGDPAAVADDLDRRHLRRDDRARLLPHAGLPGGGDRRAAPRLGHPARRRARRERSSSCCSSAAVAFQHTTDADFEAELDFEARVRAFVA